MRSLTQDRPTTLHTKRFRFLRVNSGGGADHPMPPDLDGFAVELSGALMPPKSAKLAREYATVFNGSSLTPELTRRPGIAVVVRGAVRDAAVELGLAIAKSLG